MRELKNIESWCERFNEENNIRVHPASAPLPEIVDELLGRMANNASLDSLKQYVDNMLSIYQSINKRVTELESVILSKEKPKLPKRKKNE